MVNQKLQDTRIAVLTTPLGKDKLAITRFDGTEGLSELFECRIEAVSDDENINFDKALGRNASVSFKTHDGSERHFDGILTEAQWLGVRNTEYVYRIVLRPWFWLLGHQSDSRIFANMTAPDIIAEVFGEHGFAKFRNNLSKSYRTLEYCVQFRESDLAFVCRLMEREGISYYFEHEKGQHTLVMADSSTSYQPIPGSTRPFIPLSAGERREEEHIYHWIPERRFTSGKVVLNDYDFKKPTSDMKVDKQGNGAYANANLEMYEYPGNYYETGDGQNYAEARLNAEQALDKRVLCSGDSIHCYPGGLMTLKDHPNGAQNREYLILRATHTFVSESYRSGAVMDADDTYQGNYELLPSDRDFAPLCTTEKPRIYGPQTARVVGDGEIDVDEDGRVLVEFHWDRDDKKSRRCRVAQVWAGKEWGGIFIPRVGMEAVINFLDGDPDRPFVSGTVYNEDNKPPYSLPGDKTIAGWKTESSEGGGGYNEFIFEDKAGSEKIRFHAEKDLEGTVKNDETREVGNDRDTEIGSNDTLDVGKVLDIEAGQKIRLKCGQSTITMTQTDITIKSMTIKVQASMDLTTKGLFATHKADAIMTIKGGMVFIN
ncbi:MAG: type VI secretion system tip protein TssI/VgrG [Pseudomonadota bacterium]